MEKDLAEGVDWIQKGISNVSIKRRLFTEFELALAKWLRQHCYECRGITDGEANGEYRNDLLPER